MRLAAALIQADITDCTSGQPSVSTHVSSERFGLGHGLMLYDTVNVRFECALFTVASTEAMREGRSAHGSTSRAAGRLMLFTFGKPRCSTGVDSETPRLSPWRPPLKPPPRERGGLNADIPPVRAEYLLPFD